MINLTKKDILIPIKAPKLIVIVGPCRTGTTAFANVFAKAGITVYMQPIKSARRAKEAGKKIIPWKIKEESMAVVKETLGAITEAEFFDPIEILLNIGYPREKLVLIAMVRNPYKTLSSWREMWTNLDLSNFERSYQNIFDIKNRARNKDIKTIAFVHEATRDNTPNSVVQKMFAKIDFYKKTGKKVINWTDESKFGEDNSNKSKLKFYDAPPEKFIKEVKNWGEYKYRDEPYLKLFQSDADFIVKNKNLKRIYEDFRLGCEKDLELKIRG